MSTASHAAVYEKNLLGFWTYLMTDLLMFAVLFATYAVLRDATFGGPGGRELFSLPNALAETLILLTSSFTCGMAMINAREGRVRPTLAWFGATFALGATFLGLELREFAELLAEGHGPQANAFLSAFFTLVGTHGLHIVTGLLWMTIALYHVRRRGLTPFIVSKLEGLSVFWHFLDVVWIFLFTVVYLMSRV